MAPPYPPVQKPRLHRSDFVHKPLARSSSDQNAPVTFLRRSDGRSLRTPTLTVHPTRNVNQPETLADLEALVKEAHENEKRRGSDPLPRTIELSKDKDPELDVALVLLLSIQICFSSKWSGATKDKPKYTTHDALKHLKEVIEKEATEQRWTAPSKSPISPAFSTAEDELFSWVGIIMYLPTADPRQRKDITDEFYHYRRLTQTQLWDQYSAYEHWAKSEIPKDKEELEAALQERLRKRFPVDAYNKATKIPS
ncbi:hypothetical protein Bca101_005892 [Brassica carinata]